MMRKQSPLSPSVPARKAELIGHEEAKQYIRNILENVRNGYPSNFMIIGKRGVGKTSFLNHLMRLARSDDFKFLVVVTDLSSATTAVALVKKIKLALEFSIHSDNKIEKFKSDLWEKIQRVTIQGSSIDKKPEPAEVEVLWEDLAYDLAKTIQTITGEKDSYDGLLLLFDEVDTFEENLLKFGTFLKQLTERLFRLDCFNFSIGVAGLPGAQKKLWRDHPSSLRLFKVINLKNLAKEECDRMIQYHVDKFHNLYKETFTITEKFKDLMYESSEGSPYIISQIMIASIERCEHSELDEKLFEIALSNVLRDIGDDLFTENFLNLKHEDESVEMLIEFFRRLLEQDPHINFKDILDNSEGVKERYEELIRAIEEIGIVEKSDSDNHYKISSKILMHWLSVVVETPQSFLGARITRTIW